MWRLNSRSFDERSESTKMSTCGISRNNYFFIDASTSTVKTPIVTQFWVLHIGVNMGVPQKCLTSLNLRRIFIPTENNDDR